MKRQLQRKLALSLLIGMTAFGLAACEEEGPAEQAGESIDESTEEMGDEMEQAADEEQN